MSKNNITTQGYFVKRLRDNGFLTSRVYDRYSEDDPRKWTVVVNPTTDSVLITCVAAQEWPYKGHYNVDDGGMKIPKGLYINTDSIEVIIQHLLQFNIPQLEINRYSGRSRKEKKEKV